MTTTYATWNKEADEFLPCTETNKPLAEAFARMFLKDYLIVEYGSNDYEALAMVSKHRLGDLAAMLRTPANPATLNQLGRI